MSGTNTGRTLPKSDYVRLAAYAKELVKMTGGVDATSMVTRVSPSQLSRYGNPQNLEGMPIDVLADLEHEAGEPLLTRVLARMSGFALVKLPREASEPDWVGNMGQLSKEFADVVSRVGECLRDDGKVSASEVKNHNLRKEIAELISIAVKLDKTCEVIEQEVAL
ncbi:MULTISPECIES: hypothetical protein [unclassified Pseudovibrio]|uniref:hypothetical protein n=1 Tax=unclassified Pseudovibrio TaxID=2627060 RepID=UPI0007AE98F0|nr:MULTISPECIES: hypothetical protein [unclassified Pseudovibrio]KZL02291.1 hypothetical protein PsW74_01389 [Pseudovibrio sp. W74]KZL08165.1 hypothetical protein PsAD14_03312 [Pseudovibrio sp. Ad14]